MIQMEKHINSLIALANEMNKAFMETEKYATELRKELRRIGKQEISGQYMDGPLYFLEPESFKNEIIKGVKAYYKRNKIKEEAEAIPFPPPNPEPIITHSAVGG